MNVDTLVATIKALARPLYRRVVPYPTLDKNASELSFWRREYEQEGGRFENSWYRALMLEIAGERDERFLADKVVADFGCGPRGTLQWATVARKRIGIDVLANAYLGNFNLSAHDMEYVANTEHSIPLPTGSVDILFTINALDHVDHFERMCTEILRVLKPGGELIGSFNLHEPPTPCEPQTLDEARIAANLLDHLEIKSRRTAPKGPFGDRYVHCLNNVPTQGKEEAFLWVRASNPIGRTTDA